MTPTTFMGYPVVMTDSPLPRHGTFEYAWSRADCVPGWLTEGEAQLLWKAANAISEDGQIVEIGAFHGRSTTVLAESGRSILTIDPLAGNTIDDGTGKKSCGDDAADSLADLVDTYSNLEWARRMSCDVQCEPYIDLLFIDGNHIHPAPLTDFWNFAPKLRDGALVAFHDFRDGRAASDGRSDPDVDKAVLALERMGQLERIERKGTMYLGRRRVQRQEVFLAQPYGAFIHPQSEQSIERASFRGGTLGIAKCPHPSSLLAHGFNTQLATCLNMGGFDYWLLLHQDVSPITPGWLDIVINELEFHNLDALHVVCAIKDNRGLTSTAYSSTGDKWSERCKLSTTQLLEVLPPTFTIDDVRAKLDPQAQVLLPNTGCLLLRIGEWLDRFPGFTISDRLGWKDGKRVAQTAPEDWQFGFWAASEGVRVGGTSCIATAHYGDFPYHTLRPWGTHRSTNEI